MKECLEKNNVIRKLISTKIGKQRVLFRPDSASRGSLNGPHTMQVVLIWSWVARGQDTTRRLILNGAPTLRWKGEMKEVNNEQG